MDSMSDTNRMREVRILVLGTCHEYQRFQQDNDANRHRIRREFETEICRIVESENIDLIAEEAGDDKAVAASLTAQGYPQSPQEPIAKKVSHNRCRHIDIRPPGDHGADDDYERKMVDFTVKHLGEAVKVLVIVGKDHRCSVARRFFERGFRTDTLQFPALALRVLKSCAQKRL